MYKVTNLTDAYIKYNKILFAPRESKILDITEIIKHEDFNVEKINETEKAEKPEKKTKMKGGLK